VGAATEFAARIFTMNIMMPVVVVRVRALLVGVAVVVRPVVVVGEAKVVRAVVAAVIVAADGVAAGEVTAVVVAGVRGRWLGGEGSRFNGFRGAWSRRVSMKWPLALREARERSDPV
jgi:hypothetical protein